MTSFYYVTVPVLDMRKEPSDLAEMVSQALFAEAIELIDAHKSQEWVKIITLADGYQGWVKQSGICCCSQAYLQSPPEYTVTTNRLAAHLYHVEDTIYGPIMTLPFGCSLEVYDNDSNTSCAHHRWIKVMLPDGRGAYIQRGDVFANSREPLTREEVCRFSLSFLGLPYTWGGRSSFGYDCSGFVQMLYGQIGIRCPRDSSEQCVWRRLKEAPIDALSPGDLIFYGHAPDQIRHVGLWLGNNQFIHTSAVTENAPYVRISSINDPAWNGAGYYPYFCGRCLN